MRRATKPGTDVHTDEGHASDDLGDHNRSTTRTRGRRSLIYTRDAPNGRACVHPCHYA